MGAVYISMMFGVKRSRIAEARVARAAETLYRDRQLNDEALIALLQKDGFGEGESVRLVSFIPTAFIKPLLDEHGIVLHSEVSGRDARGNWVLAKLRKQPEYVAALRLARRHRRKGVIDEVAYEWIVKSSSQSDVLAKAAERGIDVAGGVIAVSLPAPGVARYFVGPIRPFPSDADAGG